MSHPTRRRSLFGAALLAAMLAARGLQAQSVPVEKPVPGLVKLLPERLATAKSVTVAVALGSPPDDFRDAQGEINGWEIDILRAATQALGVQLDLRPTTFDTLIPGLQSKRFDAAVGQIGVTDLRLKVLDMIGTLRANELFAALTGSELKVKTLGDLCGVTVSTVRGSREFEFAQAYQPQCAAAGKQPINMLVFSDGNAAADSLMSKRSEVIWLGSTTISYFVSQTKGKTKVVGSYTDTSYIGVALSKNSDSSPALQAAIQHLLEDGTYKAILAKWGLEDGAASKISLNPTGNPS